MARMSQSRSLAPERNAPGSAKLRFIRLSCCDTRIFWDSSLLTIKVFIFYANRAKADQSCLTPKLFC